VVSIPILIGAIWFAWSTSGPNWFVGAFGLLISLNLMIQVVGYFMVPRLFARRASDLVTEVETSASGIRISRGENSFKLPWRSFTRIWSYDDFVILAAKPQFNLTGFFVLPSSGMSQLMRDDLQAASQGRADTIT
jgi:hypothetical protein